MGMECWLGARMLPCGAIWQIESQRNQTLGISLPLVERLTHSATWVK